MMICKCVYLWRYGVATFSRLLKIIGLFYRALLQERPIILRSLLIIATPYVYTCYTSGSKAVCVRARAGA